MVTDIDRRIVFHDDQELLEIELADFHFEGSADVNRFYDRIEELIADSGEDLWFFLLNRSGMRIAPSARTTHAHRAEVLNLAHSQGTVHLDERDTAARPDAGQAETEVEGPELFADRSDALQRIEEFVSHRRQKPEHVPNFGSEELRRRIRFLPDLEIMDVDMSDLTIEHSGDVRALYDFLEAEIGKTRRKWYFLINYENTRIFPEAWVSYARRGKLLNLTHSLGSVRYAPGSETAETIRMRAESQEFRPNIRNTRDEALERIREMQREGS